MNQAQARGEPDAVVARLPPIEGIHSGGVGGDLGNAQVLPQSLDVPGGRSGDLAAVIAQGDQGIGKRR